MGNTQEVKGTISRIAGNGKGFQIEGDAGWFNATETSAPYLAKLTKGTEVEISFFKKGVGRIVTKISKVESAQEPAAEKAEGTCTVCGKVLKNPSFPTCWTCKDKVKKEEPATKVYDAPQTAVKKDTYDKYNNSEKTAQIQRGNALNAAGAVMSNPNINMQDNSPEAMIEITKVMADAFLDWLRAE